MFRIDTFLNPKTKYYPALFTPRTIQLPFTVLGIYSPERPSRVNLRACIKYAKKVCLNRRNLIFALKAIYTIASICFSNIPYSNYSYNNLTPSIKYPKTDKTPIENHASLRTTELDLEIACLIKHIKFFDRFISSKPDLLQKCIEYYDKDCVALFIIPDDLLKQLDPTNTIDKMTLRSIAKRTLLYQFNERLLFIQRYPEIWNLFKKHVTRHFIFSQLNNNNKNGNYKLT